MSVLPARGRESGPGRALDSAARQIGRRWQCFVDAIRAQRAATYATAASTSDHGAVMNLYVTDGNGTITQTDHRVDYTGRPIARSGRNGTVPVAEFAAKVCE